MERSNFMSPSSSRRRQARMLAAVFVAAIILWDSTAYAINAIVSQDLPILTEMAATEAASYLELGSILTEAAALVKTFNEYTTLAKTVWGAIDELRNMSLDDIKNGVLQGLNNAFPEVAEMYGDIKDIRDLNHRNPEALATLRGMLWEYAYGPGIDYLHSAHSDFEAVTESSELRTRQSVVAEVRRKQIEQWQDDCDRTAADGAEGACQAAAHRATIQQALMLHDLHESQLKSLELQEHMITANDEKQLNELYAYDRWVYDLKNLVAATSESGDCEAGKCLYERYGDAMQRRVQQFRARHGRDYSYRINTTQLQK